MHTERKVTKRDVWGVRFRAHRGLVILTPWFSLFVGVVCYDPVDHSLWSGVRVQWKPDPNWQPGSGRRYFTREWNRTLGRRYLR